MQPLSVLPYYIGEHSAPDSFPHVDCALTEPNGLLAIGGDLTPARLLNAYRRGIFPWFNDDRYILWWSPDPRAVLSPALLNVSRSLGKTLRQGRYGVTVNEAFERVVMGCAAPRPQQDGTWITRKMGTAYVRLHRLGYAHSIECWRGSELAGGLYGVALGKVFFGESMFSRQRDASKVALAYLCRADFQVIDCQIPNPHLSRMGAQAISRQRFVSLLDRWCGSDTPSLAPLGTGELSWIA
ncbi:MAG: leucyl/phenylalanyl-tRNA--protein transferase [Gammaproteobacteria bacterium]